MKKMGIEGYDCTVLQEHGEAIQGTNSSERVAPVSSSSTEACATFFVILQT